MIAWSAQTEPGELIQVDGKTFRRLSSCIGRSRLRHIIAADRASVSCGRWVRCTDFFKGIPIQWCVNGKPVYRYEARR